MAVLQTLAVANYRSIRSLVMPLSHAARMIAAPPWKWPER
jgi:predicted ATPase